MSNCFVDNTTLYVNVEPKELFVPYENGYKSSVFIKRTDVVRFMEEGIVPTHDGGGIFSVTFRLNNNTKILLNGIRVTSLADERFRYIPIDLVRIKQLIIAKYSENTFRNKDTCYATRLVLQVKDPKAVKRRGE